MGITERDVEAYECPVCGSLGRHEESQCCDEPREPVDDVVTYDQPEIESVIETVFDISSSDLAICRTLVVHDEMTTKDLAAELSLDRTTINRRLNHLAELGLVEKRSRILEQGGQVHVYSQVPLDDAHRRLQLGLYRWLADAEDVLDELHKEKLELMVQEAEVESTDDPDSRVYAGERSTGTSEATDVDAPDTPDVRDDKEKSDSVGDEAADESDARADGDGNESQVPGTDEASTDDPDSSADEDANSSLMDRLLGRYRS